MRPFDQGSHELLSLGMAAIKKAFHGHDLWVDLVIYDEVLLDQLVETWTEECTWPDLIRMVRLGGEPEEEEAA